MALLFFDGFDHSNGNGNHIEDRWDEALSLTPTPETVTRFGYGYSIRYANFNAGLAKNILPALTTGIVGFAWRMGGIHSSSDRQLLRFMDGSTLHVDIRVEAVTGKLIITRNGTTLATSTNAVSADTWYFVEVKVTIDDTSGYAEVRIDGTNWASFSGDTRNGANASFNKIELTVGSSSGSSYLDDFYLCDTSGTVNNDFLGNRRVITNLPDAFGSSAQMTPTGAASNWEAVDETTADDDTSYAESTTVGHKDLYNFQALGYSGVINGVQVTTRAKNPDTGAISVQQVAKSGATEQDGTTTLMANVYKYQSSIFETDPDTAAAWTPGGYDAAEFGQKVA